MRYKVTGWRDSEPDYRAGFTELNGVFGCVHNLMDLRYCLIELEVGDEGKDSLC